MSTTFSMDAAAVSLLVGSILPILVGLITKFGAPSSLKAVILLFIAAAQGMIVNATMIDGSAVLSWNTVVVAGLGWITAIASYYGFLTPVGVSPKVNESTANFGLGKAA